MKQKCYVFGVIVVVSLKWMTRLCFSHLMKQFKAYWYIICLLFVGEGCICQWVCSDRLGMVKSRLSDTSRYPANHEQIVRRSSYYCQVWLCGMGSRCIAVTEGFWKGEVRKWVEKKLLPRGTQLTLICFNRLHFVNIERNCLDRFSFTFYFQKEVLESLFEASHFFMEYEDKPDNIDVVIPYNELPSKPPTSLVCSFVLDTTTYCLFIINII